MSVDALEQLPAIALVRRDVVTREALVLLGRGEFAVLPPNGDVWHRGPCGHVFDVSAQRGSRGEPSRYRAGVSNLDLVTMYPEVVCPDCRGEWIVAGGRIITDPRFRGMLRRRADW